MHKTVAGIFENGVIKLLEPVEAKEKTKAIITFFDENSLEMQSLSSDEIVQLARQRAQKLVELGISREIVFNHLIAVVDDIRNDAVSRGVAVDESEITE
jgi:predicted DNA-binding antitoxin AbrB/MazE fold protein